MMLENGLTSRQLVSSVTPSSFMFFFFHFLLGEPSSIPQVLSVNAILVFLLKDWRCNGKGYVTFVITFAGQEIGTVCQATKALRETGC
jgi:hypothetical protein